MSEPSRHIIKRQRITLSRVRQEDAAALQAEMRDFFYAEILPIIDRELTRMSPNGSSYAIDHLELDLGRIDPHLDKDTLLAILEKALREALRPHVQALEQRPAEPLPAARSRELLSFFVDFGILPWWADRSLTNPVQAAWEECLTNDVHWLRKQVAEWAEAEEQRLQRLLRAVSPPTFLRALAGVVDFPVDTLVEVATALARRLQRIAGTERAWSEIVPLTMVRLAVALPVDQRRGSEFWQALLLGLATRAKRPYQALLKELRQSDDSFPATELSQILDRLQAAASRGSQPEQTPSSIEVADLPALATRLIATAGWPLREENSLIEELELRWREAAANPTRATAQEVFWRSVADLVGWTYARLLQTLRDGWTDSRTKSQADSRTKPQTESRQQQDSSRPPAIDRALLPQIATELLLLPEWPLRDREELIRLLTEVQRQTMRGQSSAVTHRQFLTQLAGSVGWTFQLLLDRRQRTQHTEGKASSPKTALDRLIAIAAKTEKESEKETPEEPRPRTKRAEEPEELFIQNAGLVILWPYLTRFFSTISLVEEKAFVDEPAMHRAVGLLQYLADSQREPLEFDCGLNKVLCGLDVEEVLDFGPPVTDAEAEECDLLLTAVVANAPILKSMSIDGFRGTFLLRRGLLRPGPGIWQLHVESETYDVVLDQFPWTWSFLKLPWMKTGLEVIWGGSY